MINVDNKKTIRRLADSSFGANGFRNFFATVAIVLTTVLFTGVFTIGSSMLASVEASIVRQVGGSSHIGFKGLTMEQYETLTAHKSVKEASYTVVLGLAVNPELSRRQTELRYANDALAAELMLALPTAGHLPEDREEIALDTIVLDKLGIPAELGQSVTLQYELSGEIQEDTFTLCGYWEGDAITPASQAWLSREYVESRLEDYAPQGEEDFVGKINAEINFGNSHFLNQKLIRLVEDSEYDISELRAGVNWAYTGEKGISEPRTVLGICLLLFLLGFCGYLMISNVFYISINRDIRYYGLLKTIGTTARQIKTLIHRQALLLCCIGVPAGLLAGSLVSGIVTPFVLSALNVDVQKVSMNVWVFLGAAVFTVLTVFASIRRPVRMAGQVSPIEALRSGEGRVDTKKATKKSGGIRLWRMAMANVGRSKKKTVFVIVSLSFSLIILNISFALADSFDMEAYLSTMIDSDFMVSDFSYISSYAFYESQDTLNEAFFEQLSCQEGIEEINKIYFQDTLVPIDERLSGLVQQVEERLNPGNSWMSTLREDMESGSCLQHIYGLDSMVWEKLTVLQGQLDMEKLESGKYVVAAPYDSEGKVMYYQVGDKVELTAADGAVHTYEVLAVAHIPWNISARHTHPVNPEFFMPSEIFLRDIAEKAPMLTAVNVEDEQLADLEAFLENWEEGVDGNLAYESRASLIKEYESDQRSYRVVGTVLGILLGLIGIMNFVNTSVTSVMMRRQELAMLESIGMTRKQQIRMLGAEGLVYSLLTAFFVITAGSLLEYLGLGAVTSDAAQIGRCFTVVPSLICIPVLLALSWLVPVCSQKAALKKSVVERLREWE